MSFHVAHSSLGLVVWPVFGMNPPEYATIASLLIADESLKGDALAALVRAGLLATWPPRSLTQVMEMGTWSTTCYRLRLLIAHWRFGRPRLRHHID